MNIDLVIPYVDSSDKNWQSLFDKYNPIKDKEIEAINAKNRFRGQGDFFKYWFRCVETNMPWIRFIHLIVQSESQIPTWLNRNNDRLKIVLHKDIIPEEYLPTFNSTCIEMFLWKIPDLSEHFIYTNDDFYPLRELKPEYFFESNKVRTNSNRVVSSNNINMYTNHCVNAYCLVHNLNKEEELAKGKLFPVFPHRMRPYLKSCMEEAFNLYKKEILNSLSRFREEKNINIYLFDNYLIKEGYQLPKIGISNKVIGSKMDYMDIRTVLNSNCNMLAIQDDGEINIYENYTIRNWFYHHYGYKSKYEV